MGAETTDPLLSHRVVESVFIRRSYGEEDIFTNGGSSDIEAVSRGAMVPAVNTPVL